jgi:uncharacterized protein YehS (DUF1456 family)
MINNDILRRLRYTFDFDDHKMIGIFALAGFKASRDDVRAWLKQDEDADYKSCGNPAFIAFLDGLIIEKRGPKDGPAVVADMTLNNNVVFRKLKIALNLQAEDILDLLALTEFRMSKHELSAFFRKPDHKHYRECKDQILRNFLTGMQKKYHTAKPESVEQWKKKVEAKTYVKGAKKVEEAKAESSVKPEAKPKAKAPKKQHESDVERRQSELAASRKDRPAGEKKTLSLKAEVPAPAVQTPEPVQTTAPISASEPVEKPVAADTREADKVKAEAQEKAKSTFKF